MFCPKCGTQNEENAYKCTNCGEVMPRDESRPVSSYSPPSRPPDYSSSSPLPQPPLSPTTHIPDYLVYSILTTLLCCWPFGVVAIINSVGVNNKARLGDYQGATDASNRAKGWCWASFWCGLVIIIAYTIFMIIGIASEGF